MCLWLVFQLLVSKTEILGIPFLALYDLQSLPTPDGAAFVTQPPDGNSKQVRTHLSHEEFVEAFNVSQLGNGLAKSLQTPYAKEVSSVPNDPQFTSKFTNPWYRSLILVTRHEFLVWRRNTQQIKSRIIQCEFLSSEFDFYFFSLVCCLPLLLRLPYLIARHQRCFKLSRLRFPS